MNKKLRFIVTYDCPRNCEGCCNKDFSPPPKISMPQVLSGIYKEIYITGGEPLLYPKDLVNFLIKSRIFQPETKLFLYSAEASNLLNWVKILPYLNGLTFTLHEDKDFDALLDLQECLEDLSQYLPQQSLRLNNFTKKYVAHYWETKQVEWIKNCPLPKGEDIYRLDKEFTK